MIPLAKYVLSLVNAMEERSCSLQVCRENHSLCAGKPGAGEYHFHRYHELKFDLSGLEGTERIPALLILPHCDHPYTAGHLILNCDGRSSYLLVDHGGRRGMLDLSFPREQGGISGDLLGILSGLPETPAFDGMRAGLLRLLLQDIRLLLGRSNGLSPSVRTPGALAKQVLCYLEQNYHRPELSVSDIAEAFQVSPQHIGNCFRKTLRSSLRRKLTEIRLEHAARLLSRPELNIGEIAGLCGWRNQFYFSRCFRQAFGVPPRESRERSEAFPALQGEKSDFPSGNGGGTGGR